ncbi:DUF3352 domain-containing protein [bacterium]|nr:DUF3352 domain-containing protein [bacterium]
MKRFLLICFVFMFAFSISYCETIAGLKIERPLDKLIYTTNFFGVGNQLYDRFQKATDFLNVIFKKNKIDQKVSNTDIFNTIGNQILLDFEVDSNVNIVKDKNVLFNIDINLQLKQESPEAAFKLVTNVVKSFTAKSKLKVEFTKDSIKVPIPPKMGNKIRNLYIYSVKDGMKISTVENGAVKCKFDKKNLIEVYGNLKYILKQVENELAAKLKQQNSFLDVKTLINIVGDLRLFYYHTAKNYIFSGRLATKDIKTGLWKDILSSHGFNLKELPPAPKNTQVFFNTTAFLTKMYKMGKEQIKKTNPKAYENFLAKEKMFSEKTGIDVETEILSWIGSRITVVVKDFGDMKNKVLPSIAIMIEGNDENKMKQFLGKLISFFANKPKIMFYEKRYSDVGISSTKLPFFPAGVEPSIAVIKNNFCISLNPNILKEIIDAYKKPGKLKGSDLEHFLYVDVDLENILPLIEKFAVNLFVNRFEVCKRNKGVLKKVIEDYSKEKKKKFPSGRINILKLKREKALGHFSKGPFCVYEMKKNGEVDCRVHKNGLNVEFFKKKGQEIFSKILVLKKLFMTKTRFKSGDNMMYDFEVNLER